MDGVDTIGGCPLLERIGEGGTGEVQSVHDTVLRREVAIKRLRATGASARDRFVAEGRTLATLQRAGIRIAEPQHTVHAVQRFTFRENRIALFTEVVAPES